MAKKSATEYLADGDFEGALERYENANNKRWKNYWFDVCRQIAETVSEFAQKYLINPITKTIEEKIYSKRARKRVNDRIFTEVDCLDNANQKCYLFEFYDSENNLVCSKVGTTIRKVTQRLTEELNSKTYKNLDCQTAIVKRVYDCGEMPAEGAESFLRARYIQKYPNSFKKNDRFMNELFDFEECDRLMKNYLSLGLTTC